MEKITINNKNHKNLKSNVPFEELPKWFRNIKTYNSEITYINGELLWQGGYYEGESYSDWQLYRLMNKVHENEKKASAKKRTWIICIFVTLLIMFISYSVVAFVNYELNPELWDSTSRVFCGSASIFVIIFALITILTFNDLI